MFDGSLGVNRLLGAFAFVLLAALTAGCGDAVTDPSREGFGANPRIIEGDWATIRQTVSGPVQYDAELLPAGGGPAYAGATADSSATMSHDTPPPSIWV